MGRRDDFEDVENLFDELLDYNREVQKEEYANIQVKQKGYINANFFRKDMFRAVARGKRIQYKKPKVVWEKSDKEKLAISHSLHQKHADVLSLIHTDYVSISKPKPDGSYVIYTTLYRIAKAMGYKYPEKAIDYVKQYILDLRWTDFVVYDKYGGEYRTTILDDAYYSETRDIFVISIKGKNAKILAHATAIKIEKELNKRIVGIPDNLVKIKAMVRYMLSHKPSSSGYTLNFFFDKLDIGKSDKSIQVAKNKKSIFRRQFKENEELLKSFNIHYDRESDKVFYAEQLKEIMFELPVFKEKNPKKILEKINKDSDNQNSKNSKKNDIKYKEIGKKILLNDIVYTITEITKNTNDDLYTVKVQDENNRVATIHKVNLEMLNKYIDNFVDPKVLSVISGGTTNNI